MRHHDRAVNLFGQGVVVLQRHVDGDEKLQVDLLHGAQVLDAHGDSVHHRLQFLSFARIAIDQGIIELLPQQLADISALLDTKLRLLHLLIELLKLGVVLQQSVFAGPKPGHDGVNLGLNGLILDGDVLQDLADAGDAAQQPA